jgi:hypothetical protein
LHKQPRHVEEGAAEWILLQSKKEASLHEEAAEQQEQGRKEKTPKNHK